MQNLFFITQSLLKRDISRFSAALILAAMLAALTGCGSGQAIPQVFPAPTSPTGGPAAASLQLLASNTTVASAGTTTVDLTAIVLSATKQTISGTPVTFSVGTDPTAFISNISASGVSDANGVVTAKLNIGSNKTNRTITVSATAGTAIATNSVDVTGTAISISGNSSLAFGASTTLTFSVKDSAGSVLPNITVAVASATGNTIALTPATGITNSSGQITATITATKAGNDTISASAAGASATQALTISADSFTFTTPAEGTDIPLGTAPAVSVNWTQNGVAQAGKAVSFSASRGTMTGSPSTTNATGDTPGVTISSTSAGPAIITASGPGGTPAVTRSVTFVSTTASTATVQAVPGTVQVTTASTAQTNNTSTISVLVRDAANNLVKNAAVSFNITSDPTGGQLLSSSGTTDVSGTTSVTYKAGGTSSAQNGVTISATVTSVGGVAIAPVTGTTSLTVSGQSLQVRLGTDNKVATSGTTNVKTYSAIVTDAAGNPSVGTQVQFALRPGHYEKGHFLFDAVNKIWAQVFTLPPTTSTAGACRNMDVNFNGILDPGEDAGFSWLDSTGAAVTPHLLPGAVAVVNSPATTDSSGVATATITYPKDHSYWTEVTLEARTSVTSNDPPTWVTFYLPGPASDYTDAATPPPGQISPYGNDASCFDLF